MKKVFVLCLALLPAISHAWTPTYKCHVWCSSCFSPQHGKDVRIEGAESLGQAESRAKDWYISYWTQHPTVTDFISRHNTHNHLGARCERMD